MPAEVTVSSLFVLAGSSVYISVHPDVSFSDQ